MVEPNKTKVKCRLTALEAAALSFALAVINDLDVSPEQLTDEVTVGDRTISKVGSNVAFDRSEILKTKIPYVRKVYDHIAGSLHDGSVEFGVLVFVNDGYISDLELFVYGHGFGFDWPKQQSEFNLFINKAELS